MREGGRYPGRRGLVRHEGAGGVRCPPARPGQPGSCGRPAHSRSDRIKRTAIAAALRQGGRRACAASSTPPPPRRMRGESAGGAISLWPRRGLRACAVVRAAGRLREGPGEAAVAPGAVSGPGLPLRLKRAPGPGNLRQGLP